VKLPPARVTTAAAIFAILLVHGLTSLVSALLWTPMALVYGRYRTLVGPATTILNAIVVLVAIALLLALARRARGRRSDLLRTTAILIFGYGVIIIGMSVLQQLILQLMQILPLQNLSGMVSIGVVALLCAAVLFSLYGRTRNA
jgi:hypothetical protein